MDAHAGPMPRSGGELSSTWPPGSKGRRLPAGGADPARGGGPPPPRAAGLEGGGAPGGGPAPRLTHDLGSYRFRRVGQADGQPLDLDAHPPRRRGREALLFDQLMDVTRPEGPAGGGHGYRYP